MLKLMVQAIDGEGWYDAGCSPKCITHTLDVAGACYATARIAFGLADKPWPIAAASWGKWREVTMNLLPCQEDEGIL